MIDLKGRHPAEPVSLKIDSKAAVDALVAEAKASVPPVFAEDDFPNHWGKHKHHFILRQYNGKCAYCETPVVSGNPGDVEHFRPKAYCQALKPAKNRNDYAGQPPGRSNSGSKTEGYWWLAYSWDNYLFSCTRCNSSWKRNQFPIGAKKAKHGEKLSSEQPLLINPFVVDPEKHFEFDANTGQIRGATPQGVATIDVCGLDRRSLEIQRATKGAKLIKRHNEYLIALKEKNDLAQNNALRALIDECRSKEAFAAVARYFVKDRLQMTYSDLLSLKRNRLI